MERRTSPVSCSWSLSRLLCLTAYKWAWPLANRTHTHRFPTQPQVKCGGNSVMEQDLWWPLCVQRHWLFVLHTDVSFLTIWPLTLWCHFWPLVVETQVFKTRTNSNKKDELKQYPCTAYISQFIILFTTTYTEIQSSNMSFPPQCCSISITGAGSL